MIDINKLTNTATIRKATLQANVIDILKHTFIEIIIPNLSTFMKYRHFCHSDPDGPIALDHAAFEILID